MQNPERFVLDQLPPYHYGRYGRNEYLIANVLGRTIKFDVQPYTRGVGQIVAVTPRDITVSEFIPAKGQCSITYELFDLEVAVFEGSHTGALCAGVPVPGTTRDITGTIQPLTLDRADLSRCVLGDAPQTYVHATCG